MGLLEHIGFGGLGGILGIAGHLFTAGLSIWYKHLQYKETEGSQDETVQIASL